MMGQATSEAPPKVWIDDAKRRGEAIIREAVAREKERQRRHLDRTKETAVTDKDDRDT